MYFCVFMQCNSQWGLGLHTLTSWCKCWPYSATWGVILKSFIILYLSCICFAVKPSEHLFFISIDFSRFRHICEPWTCKIRKTCIKDVVLWLNDSFTILLHFKGFPRKRDLYFYDFCAILYDFLENQLLSIVIDWESTWISRKSTKKISIIGEPKDLLYWIYAFY